MRTDSDSHKPLVSVIVPMFNERDNIRPLAERIRAALEECCVPFEILFVDDGSRDGSAERVEQMSDEIPQVRLVCLSRNFGKESAMLAGYDHAHGEAIIVIDADLQQPPELFPDLLAHWRDGYDVVNVVRRTTAGLPAWRKGLSQGFYWVCNRLCRVPIEANAVDFRLLDRSVVDAIRNCREQHRFNRALVSWAGFRATSIEYTAARRHAGVTHWRTLGLIQYAVDGIVSFSGTPLRIAGLAGSFVSALSFLYLGVVVALRLLRPELFGNSFGYASIVGMVSLLGGIQLLAVWVLGEYVGRIFEQVKDRPAYLTRPTPAESRQRRASRQTTVVPRAQRLESRSPGRMAAIDPAS